MILGTNDGRLANDNSPVLQEKQPGRRMHVKPCTKERREIVGLHLLYDLLALQMTAKLFLMASSAVSLVGRAQSLFRRQALTASTKAGLVVTRMALASVSCSAWKYNGRGGGDGVDVGGK